MSINPNEDTEFNDALRKHGIIPPREPTPPSPPPPESPSLDELLDDFSLSELQELGEDAQDDEAERTIAAYRRQRMAEQQQEEKKSRFGRVYPIGREDYTREVTDASNVDEEDDSEGRGTGVVCFLYKDGMPRSDRAFEHIRALAAKYPRTKFVSIIGNKCIPDLPDTRVPMFIIYRKGDIRNQVVSWGADHERRPEELEALLMIAGAIEIPEKRRLGEGQGEEEDSDDDDRDNDDPSSRMRSAVTRTNGRTTRNIRSSVKRDDDSDSEFEFDL